jgi:hypothetical protein
MIKELNRIACDGHRLGKGNGLKYYHADLRITTFRADGTDTRKGKQELLSLVRQVISEGNPVVVGFNANDFITPSLRSGEHEATVVGGIVVDDACYYVVKNSWGVGCWPYDKEDIEKKYLRCLEESGLIAIRSDLLTDVIFRWVK